MTDPIYRDPTQGCTEREIEDVVRFIFDRLNLAPGTDVAVVISFAPTDEGHHDYVIGAISNADAMTAAMSHALATVASQSPSYAHMVAPEILNKGRINYVEYDHNGRGKILPKDRN